MKYRKVLIFFVLILLVLTGNHYFSWSALVGQAFDRLELLIEEHLALAAGLYLVVTLAGCVVLALPGITFAIAAGMLFGPVMGTILCSLATTMGAMLSFWVGRYFLKDAVRPLVMKNAYIKRWLFDQSGEKILFVLMLTRLIPLFPYNLQNFAYGITDISFAAYSVGSLVFMLPGTAMYTLGAVGLVDSDKRLMYFGMAGLLALVVVGLSTFLKKRYMNEDQPQDRGME